MMLTLQRFKEMIAAAGEVIRAGEKHFSELDAAAAAARAAYVSEAALAVGGVAAARSFVYPLWEALRQLMRLEIRPEEVESVVAETERMVEAAGG